MPHKGKNIYAQYDRKNLEAAVQAVQSGCSYRKAAKKWGIPKSTIRDRITGRVPEGAIPGKKTAFPAEVEERLAANVKAAAEKGFGITRLQLCMRAAVIANRLSLKTPFRNNIPGKDWCAGFQKRNGLSLKRPMPLATVRARLLNPTITNNYYDDLETTIEKLGLQGKPERIWNLDETNLPLTHKPVKVLAERGSKNIPGRVGNCRDGVTLLACINAAGGHVPPMAIVKGKTQKSLHAYDTSRGPAGAKYTWQERGWMEDTLGEVWFRDHFLKRCGSERPQLIVLDSHTSHETLGLIEAAREQQIELFAFPPHTTQWLCPLDKSVFSPLSKAFARICSEYMSTSPNHIVCKWEWPRLMGDAYNQAFTPSNIISGFRQCGIYPLSKSAIPVSAFAPSDPFNGPSPSSTVEFSTPEKDKDPTLPVTITPSSHVEVLDDTASAEDVLHAGSLMDMSVSDLLSTSFFASAVDEVAPPFAAVVDSVFHLEPVAQKPAQKKGGRKKLTSHRLLTSDEIFLQKKEEKEAKAKKEAEKKEKQLARKLKKATANKNAGKVKKPTKKNKNASTAERHFTDILSS